MKMRQHYCVVITPSNRGGSWRSTELLLNELLKIVKLDIILCAGKLHSAVKIKSKYVRQIYLDSLDIYKLHGSLLGVLLISLLFIPLGFCALLLCMIYNPVLIITNGVVPTILLILYKLIKRNNVLVILEYHGAIKSIIPSVLLKLLKIVTDNTVDIAIVNSIGSYRDLSLLINSNKIAILKHPINDVFFKISNKDEIRKDIKLNTDDFIVTFVGHLTYEKCFDIFLKVMMKILKEYKINKIKFIIIGRGPLEKYAKLLSMKYNNVIYLGYISNPVILNKYYVASDIIWSYADETYLARPAAEALASGTPVIIPDIPAVISKRLKNITIPKSLIPSSIGYIVNHNEIDRIASLLVNLCNSKGKLISMQTKARNYALRRYSKQKLIALVRIIHNRLVNILAFREKDTK